MRLDSALQRVDVADILVWEDQAEDPVVAFNRDRYVVTAQASVNDGRRTESIGAAPIHQLQGEALCNAMMKAETKAKRRATLDLLGLGMMDETELSAEPHKAALNIITPQVQKWLKAPECLSHWFPPVW